MNTDLTDIIAQMPGWAHAPDLQIKPIGGLTNTNHLVTVNGERFVVRVSGMNTAPLGIDREAELEVLTAASSAGIGAEVVRFFLPEGHLITRVIDGRHWTFTEYRTPENLRRVVEVVKQLHRLPAVRTTFSPFRRVESFARQAKAFNVAFPEDFGDFLKKMEAIKSDQERDTQAWLRFCHNDLFWVNFLDDGRVRFIDWEFAGMGDFYFDLAALVYAFDSDSPLSAELETFILECYFGEAHAAHQARLEGMKFMLLFFTAMWGMLHTGLQSQGLTPVPDDFDYAKYADNTFAVMRECLR